MTQKPGHRIHEPQPSEPVKIGGGGLVVLAAVLSMATVVVFLFLLISGCSSNPKDDPNIYNCGNGYYRPTKAQCP